MTLGRKSRARIYLEPREILPERKPFGWYEAEDNNKARESKLFQVLDQVAQLGDSQFEKMLGAVMTDERLSFGERDKFLNAYLKVKRKGSQPSEILNECLKLRLIKVSGIDVGINSGLKSPDRYLVEDVLPPYLGL